MLSPAANQYCLPAPLSSRETRLARHFFNKSSSPQLLDEEQQAPRIIPGPWTCGSSTTLSQVSFPGGRISWLIDSTCSDGWIARAPPSVHLRALQPSSPGAARLISGARHQHATLTRQQFNRQEAGTTTSANTPPCRDGVIKWDHRFQNRFVWFQSFQKVCPVRCRLR